MRVLLVEDEGRIADFVSRGLSEQGYAVDVAPDGDEALQWAKVAEFDVVVLDVMLPGPDGIEVCRTLRERGLRTPILMLTARDSVGDRVRGLDSGADDYLVKPFAFAELLARLRALIRRQPSVVGSVLEVGDLNFDTATLRASRGGRAVVLTSKECGLLEYLMRHPNQVLTRTMIAEHVWNYEFDNVTNVIDVHIRNLRRKIDEDFPVKLIQTVRGAGYRIESPAPGLTVPIFASIRVRLTLWYVLILAVILAALGTGVYIAMRQALYSNLDETIRTQAEVLIGSIRYEGGATLSRPRSDLGRPGGR